ncbi:hypothetical protein ABPG77_002184 [Micractinium sp. CCAP 211/92]
MASAKGSSTPPPPPPPPPPPSSSCLSGHLLASPAMPTPLCNVRPSSCNPCIDPYTSGLPLVDPQPSCHALPAVTCPACCRYLLLDNCPDMKLILEAFQLSAAQAVAYPRAPGLLRCLMAGRLVTAPLSPALQAWLAAQRRRAYEDGRTALLSGLPRCLVPLTPSLDQAGGLQRLALRGHTSAVTRVLLTPSGTDAVTASADGTARVWDLDIGDCVLLLEGHAGPINDMAVTSDGSLVLTCSSDGTARAFEMERGQCLRVLAGHTAGINALAMDPWARFVVTASSDGTARVWDLSSARTVHVLLTGVTQEQGEAGCVVWGGGKVCGWWKGCWVEGTRLSGIGRGTGLQACCKGARFRCSLSMCMAAALG